MATSYQCYNEHVWLWNCNGYGWWPMRVRVRIVSDLVVTVLLLSGVLRLAAAVWRFPCRLPSRDAAIDKAGQVPPKLSRNVNNFD